MSTTNKLSAQEQMELEQLQAKIKSLKAKAKGKTVRQWDVEFVDDDSQKTIKAPADLYFYVYLDNGKTRWIKDTAKVKRTKSII